MRFLSLNTVFIVLLFCMQNLFSQDMSIAFHATSCLHNTMNDSWYVAEITDSDKCFCIDTGSVKWKEISTDSIAYWFKNKIICLKRNISKKDSLPEIKMFINSSYYELYIDEKLVSKNYNRDGELKGINFFFVPHVYFNEGKQHFICIKTFVSEGWRMNFYKVEHRCVYDILTNVSFIIQLINSFTWINVSLFAIFILFYIYYPSYKNTLYFSLSTFSFSVVSYFLGVMINKIVLSEFTSENLFAIEESQTLLYRIIICLFFILIPFNLLFFFNVPYRKKSVIIASSVSILSFFVSQISIILLFIYFLFESIRSLIYSIRQKIKNAHIIQLGFLFFILFLSLNISSGFDNKWLIICNIYCIPVSMALYLAKEFASINKNLEKSLKEVRVLSEKNIQQEKEKQRILQEQNIILEQKVQDRTKEILEQKIIIEEKNRNITESIAYASKIQNALLHSEKKFLKILNERVFLKDIFILYLPKDIVSGDFYYLNYVPQAESFYIGALDSTGHGVPGAFMSLLNFNLVNEAINERNIFEPHLIFNYVKEKLKEKLISENHKDGMDGVLLQIKKENGSLKINYAAAYNPPLICIQNTIRELAFDRQSVGYDYKDTDFNMYSVPDAVETIYLYTDGIVDQFGGEKNKKLGYRKFMEYLLQISNYPMAEQKDRLINFFNNWKNKNEQTDDVLIIGLKIK